MTANSILAGPTESEGVGGFVAAVATNVAGELSSATNGAALSVDGGVVKAILEVQSLES